MNDKDMVLGIVKGGQFRRVPPEGGASSAGRLTRIAPQAAVPPESEEIQLADYEGAAIMVTGLDQGG